MRSLKTITIEKEITHQIFCNQCGQEIKKNSHGYFDDHLHVEKSWGYPSKKDGTTHQFDLCENCYDRLIQSFQIKP